ncbi:MAG TPA: STAS domain-containing protein [Vicinamibacterales bacterium]|nr:STAS domain-containing protein [Vicinamibacterales bacterium]
MQHSQRQVGPVTVMTLAGRLVAEDVPALRAMMTAALSLGQRRTVLDLGDLAYLDSAALGELVACQLRASRVGAPLRLAAVEGRLKDLLHVTRLITVFDTHDTVAAAVRAFTERKLPVRL